MNLIYWTTTSSIHQILYIQRTTTLSSRATFPRTTRALIFNPSSIIPSSNSSSNTKCTMPALVPRKATFYHIKTTPHFFSSNNNLSLHLKIISCTAPSCQLLPAHKTCQAALLLAETQLFKEIYSLNNYKDEETYSYK